MVSNTPQPLLTPGKEQVPIIQEAGWAPGPVWTGVENLAPHWDSSLCKVSFNSCQIVMKLVFSRQILKNTQLSNLMEIGPVGAKLLDADGQTDKQSDRHQETKCRLSQHCERVYKQKV